MRHRPADGRRAHRTLRRSPRRRHDPFRRTDPLCPEPAGPAAERDDTPPGRRFSLHRRRGGADGRRDPPRPRTRSRRGGFRAADSGRRGGRDAHGAARARGRGDGGDVSPGVRHDARFPAGARSGHPHRMPPGAHLRRPQHGAGGHRNAACAGGAGGRTHRGHGGERRPDCWPPQGSTPCISAPAGNAKAACASAIRRSRWAGAPAFPNTP